MEGWQGPKGASHGLLPPCEQEAATKGRTSIEARPGHGHLSSVHTSTEARPGHRHLSSVQTRRPMRAPLPEPNQLARDTASSPGMLPVQSPAWTHSLDSLCSSSTKGSCSSTGHLSDQIIPFPLHSANTLTLHNVRPSPFRFREALSNTECQFPKKCW